MLDLKLGLSGTDISHTLRKFVLLWLQAKDLKPTESSTSHVVFTEDCDISEYILRDNLMRQLR